MTETKAVLHCSCCRKGQEAIEPLTGEEPSEEAIRTHMKAFGNNYYSTREKLREKAYGGKPPGGFQSWGDYWKAC